MVNTLVKNKCYVSFYASSTFTLTFYNKVRLVYNGYSFHLRLIIIVIIIIVLIGSDDWVQFQIIHEILKLPI